MKKTETRGTTGARRLLRWAATGLALTAGMVLLALDVREGADGWLTAFVLTKAAGMGLLALAGLCCRDLPEAQDGEGEGD